ncbi:MAG: Gfo/Idh/MocA family oxidoreductase [Rubellimicrobium sp.]|nr:Gfo/Idh/MocA family oxidoreductase [Rubellimicrobium sp.]
MSTPYRLAVIGVGDVAYRDYLPAMPRIADLARIEMVIARDPARTAAAARDFGIPRQANDWRAALEDGIDAVINLTPAPVHGKINLALAQAGRPFYSEKPLARDLAEGRAIRAAARASGGVIASAPSVMVYPQVMVAQAILVSGELGPIHSVRATATTAPPPWDGFVGDHQPYFTSEVGPLSDMGCYPLHALTGLLGPVAAVSAMGRRTRDGFDVTEGPFAGDHVPVEVDDNLKAILQMKNGILASLQVAFCIRQRDSCHVEISGEDGSMTIAILDPTAPLIVSTRKGTREEPVNHARTDGPDHILGVQDLLASLRDGRDPVIGADLALHVIAVRTAIEEAARSGARVTVDPIGE